MADYPKREPYSAHKTVRLMGRSCAAQEIGVDACWLVTIIAHVEDAKRYTGHVTFWNDQLQSIGGFSWDRLDRARRKAIKAGWLHYEKGGKGKVGKYWVKTPPQFDAIPDGAYDEDHPSCVPGFTDTSTDTTLGEVRIQTGDKLGTSSNHSSLVPNPSPIPKRESLSPPFDDLKEKWNAIQGVCKCRDATDGRKKAYRTRCGDPKWVDDLDDALAKIAESRFCRGDTDRGNWRADIDWLLKPDTLTKILEGKYDNGTNPGTTGPGQQTGPGCGVRPQPLGRVPRNTYGE